MQPPVTPYGEQAGSKKEQVARMFDNIAPSYDRLNRILSGGVDLYWRNFAIGQLKPVQPKRILDLATGTADFALAAMKLEPDQVIGVDISPQMLQVGREKIARKALDQRIELRDGDSESLEFEDESFDAITVGFGVRNFQNLDRGLAEMARVLRPGGRAVVLEPATPTVTPFRQLFRFYFHTILPPIGRLLSSDEAAYTYLPESVRAFPQGQEFIDRCTKAGFTQGKHIPLTLGICALYLLDKS